MRASRLRRGALSAAVTIALLTSGCGDDDDEDPAQAGSGSDQGAQLSAPINLADCSDWNEGSVEERLGSIDSIREFTGGPVAGAGGTGAVLSDEEAYDLFENYCENEYARGFKLYKLYGRAAAFSSQNSQPDE